MSTSALSLPPVSPAGWNLAALVDQSSQIPQFGRAWELTILENPDSGGNQEVLTISSNSWDPEALRITFDVYQAGYKSYWYGDISIYNLNSATEQKVLKQGMLVILKAGYQDQPYGEIFRGRIFQPLWEREQVTDFKVTLHCIIGLDEITGNYISTSLGAGANQNALVAAMAAASHRPIPIGDTQALAQQTSQLSRSRALFGPVRKYLDQAANSANMQWWLGSDGLFMGKLEQSSATTSLAYGPGTGLIGTPQITQDGVQFTTLLDPRIKVALPPVQMLIDMTAVRQLPKYLGDYPTILDQNGIYIVGAVRYEGDSRGNAWYSHVTGYTSVGGKLALLGPTGSLYAGTP